MALPSGIRTTGLAVLDRVGKYVAALYGGKANKSDGTGAWNRVSDFFADMVEHARPGRETTGFHFSVGMTGDVYADDVGNAGVPQIRPFSTLVAMNAWAAPDGSIATHINSSKAAAALYVRVEGSWQAR